MLSHHVRYRGSRQPLARPAAKRPGNGRGDERPAAPPRAGRRGHLGARRAATSASRTGGWRSSTSTTGDQPMTRRRRQLDHLQRRDLQLPRAARASSASDRFRTELRHRGHPARLPTAGARTALEHLRGMFAFALWDEAAQHALLRARPLRHQAVLLRRSSTASSTSPPRRRRCCRSCRAIETDLDGAQGLPHVPVLPRRQDAVQGRPASCCPATSCASRNGTRRDAALLGGLLRARLRPHRRRTSRSGSRELLDDSVDAPPAQRRPGRRLPQRRPRLEHRRRRSPRRARAATIAGFTGRFAIGRGYDESRYARGARRRARLRRCTRSTSAPTTSSSDIGEVIYHLDYPVAGPGLVPAVHGLASWPREHRKVVLGGQGGDEIFGGYARYLIAYFEQCIKAAIDGTMHSGNFVVTYESIIPNLGALREYKPLLQEFWRDGLFEDLDARYFRLINRAPTLGDEIDWDALGDYSPFETFQDDLPRRQRRQGVVLRPDDALRLQDAAAGAAAGRGPREHGARPRVARAVPRPPARRARGDDAGRRQVQGRPR